MGGDYWNGLLDWLKNFTLGNDYISQEDMMLITSTDDPEQAISVINDFYKKRDFQENFA
jgi:predicted Rossmann-fold nucleotide-binding protein